MFAAFIDSECNICVFILKVVFYELQFSHNSLSTVLNVSNSHTCYKYMRLAANASHVYLSDQTQG